MGESETEYDLGYEIAFNGLCRLSYAHLKDTHQQVLVQEFLPERFPSMEICLAYRQNALQIHSFFECQHDCTSHNLLKIAEGGLESSIPYLIYESLQNLTTLKDWFENSDQAMRFNFAMFYTQIFLPILNLVDQGHVHGIIQRNLTPMTILVQYLDDKTVHPFIWSWETAYTVAKSDLNRIKDPKELNTLEEGFDAIGTPGFLAPEISMGRQPLIMSDIYNLGAILYYLVTNGSARETMESLEDFILDPITNGFKIDAELNAIIVKATQSEPKNRYHCITEFQAALDQYLIQFNLKQSILDESEENDSDNTTFQIGLEIELMPQEIIFIPLDLAQITLEDSKCLRFDREVHPKLLEELDKAGLKAKSEQFCLGYSKTRNLFYLFEGRNVNHTLVNDQPIVANLWIPIDLDQEIRIEKSRLKIHLVLN